MPRLTPVHYQKLVKVFKASGFEINRVKGDHLIMTKAGCKRPVVIKMSPSQVAVTHIKTNLNTAQISRERYFELLKQI